jgi:hypothetical protein
MTNQTPRKAIIIARMVNMIFGNKGKCGKYSEYKTIMVA